LVGTVFKKEEKKGFGVHKQISKLFDKANKFRT